MNTNPKTHGQELRRKIVDLLRSKQITISPLSLREVAKEMQLGLSTANHHIRILQDQGVIKRNEGKDSQLILSENSDELLNKIKSITSRLEEEAARTGKTQSESISSDGWQPTADGKGRYRFESLTITITPSKKKGIL